MLIQILRFLLETLFFLLIGAALLRAYMNWVRVNMSVQPGYFVMALTDWLVKPLRRTLPKPLAQSRLDWASVLAAVLSALAYALLWGVLFGVLLGAGYDWSSLGPASWLALLGFALKMLVRVALQTTMVVVLGYVLVSWLQPGSPVHSLLARLSEPLLGPLRRIVPVVGGVDLSALVLLLLLQIGLIVLA